MIVGSLGEFVFRSEEGQGNATFSALRFSRSVRAASHATIEGAPVVDVLGLDSPTVTLSGVLNAQFSGDLDAAIGSLLALQDGKPRALTRGTHCYGQFVVKTIDYSEDRWSGNTPVSVTWTMTLVGTRGV